MRRTFVSGDPSLGGPDRSGSPPVGGRVAAGGPTGADTGEVIRVLVVEDRPVARKLIEDDLLGADQIEVAGVARDGDEALRMVAALDPDVVLMDVVMPGKDGIQTLAELRRFSDVPVVVLTGAQVAPDTLEHVARRRGADAFFRKPSGSIPLEMHLIHGPLVAEIRRLATKPRPDRTRRVPNA